MARLPLPLVQGFTLTFSLQAMQWLHKMLFLHLLFVLLHFYSPFGGLLVNRESQDIAETHHFADK